MNRCLITCEPCGEQHYSRKGLNQLSPKLVELHPFPYSAEELRKEAVIRMVKMSIQGVQPKLSTRLDVKNGLFKMIDTCGRYIIKPAHATYPALPENEALSMHLARLCGIEIPVCGLVPCSDGSLAYFIRRFDRVGQKGKIPAEDFSQLAGLSRDTKYRYSHEKLIGILDQYCTFPALEKVELFKRSLFNFLIGNEDMHTKNFSLITRNGKTSLAPAYDFLSTTTTFLTMGVQSKKIEETAITLNGKKNKLTAKLWIDYFGKERLQLPEKTIDKQLNILSNAYPLWQEMIGISFLPNEQKDIFSNLLEERATRLNIV
jgi:serine/threonine-protein kinase HipA